ARAPARASGRPRPDRHRGFGLREAAGASPGTIVRAGAINAASADQLANYVRRRFLARRGLAGSDGTAIEVPRDFDQRHERRRAGEGPTIANGPTASAASG